MTRLRNLVARRNPDERGAVLVLAAFTIILIMISGALAVDVSALGTRGQELQNAADAAALAGVRTWTETGSKTQTKAVIDNVLAQNGIGNGDGTVAKITYPSATEVDVSLIDADPDVLLSSVVGIGNDLERGATARFEMCEVTCFYEILIPPPFKQVKAKGSGDGYLPIPVGDKFYAVNHYGDEIVCVDRQTQKPCWGETDPAEYAYESGSYNGDNPYLPHTATIGDRIWWTASGSKTYLYCWDTSVDQPCENQVELADLDNTDIYYSGFDFREAQRGGGTVAVGDNVYTFTDNHEVHCIEPNSRTFCASEYPALSALGEAGFPAANPNQGNHGSSIDRIVRESDGKIYSTLHIENATLGRNVDCSAPWDNPSGQVTIKSKYADRWLSKSTSYSSSIYDSGDNDDLADVWNIEPASSPGTYVFRSAVWTSRVMDANGYNGNWVAASGTVYSDDIWTITWDPSQQASLIRSNPYGTYLAYANGDIQESDLRDYGYSEHDRVRWEIWPVECRDPGYTPTPPPTLPYDEGTWVHCWDTVEKEPCDDFQAQKVHGDAAVYTGRLFFYRNSAGAEQGVCSTGFDGTGLSSSDFEIKCFDWDGNRITAWETNLNPLRNKLAGTVSGVTNSTWGNPHWNDWSNRLFFPAHAVANRVFCFDFNNLSNCGERTGQTTLGPTWDYGYHSEGNCIYGLGHLAIFWAFKASDLDEDCSGSTAQTFIEPCQCGETLRWGILEFDVTLDEFIQFDVQVVGPDGLLAFPEDEDGDGSEVHSLLTDGTTIDLSGLPTSYAGIAQDDVEFEILVTVDSGSNDPWATGAQKVAIRYIQQPILAD